MIYLYPACSSAYKRIYSTEVLARFSCTIAFGITCHQDNNTLSRLFPTSCVRKNSSGGVLACFFLFVYLFFTHIYFPASGQAVVTGVVRSPLRFLPSIFIAHRVQQSHCSSIFHRVFLTHALALSASQFVREKKSPRIYTSVHLGGFELTKLTYTRLEDSLYTPPAYL